MAGVGVAPAQVDVQCPGLHVWLGWWELAMVNCRSGPKCASIGFAHEAWAGVKHDSTLFFFAQRRMPVPLWADRLSRIT